MISVRVPSLEIGLLIFTIGAAVVAVSSSIGGRPAFFGATRAEPGSAAVSSPGVSPPSQAGSARSSAPDRLRIVVGGVEAANQDLQAIPLSRDVLAALAVDTSPDQRYARTFDLRLYHEGSSQPIDNAGVKALAKMRFMDHGTFVATAVPTGDGHYQLTLPFVMSGEWQVDVQFATPEDKGSIQVNLDVWQ
jgi:hypothetical protein